ncbi:ankyrin repeat and MYND domain-containing protein 1-like isoform X3 [Dunckerocampus dactyliophorus]|uniref:ankyrin repeat and MYND domain-containing protein 1-like isoform X3 n=1 Tax=Dunckerocampus dactyliophorus TaxID=161453 RepID=UPI002405E693|nr:ankyrin repeat and MYND domain-containing protein 1-like isoform X3 [Dunckerocampus dactyliophorus]
MSTRDGVAVVRAANANIGVRQGFGVQESPDGSKYEGVFLDGLKHGSGRYTWNSGEFYEGSFYKDYRHGDGVYYWPSGNKFIGKFYLNWREGYGKHLYPDGATFKGLYHADQRFGPGVLSEPSGHQDVGIWNGKYLIQLCNTVEDSFSLKSIPEYADYLAQTTASHSLCQPPQTVISDLREHARTDFEVDQDDNLLYDANTIIPSGIEHYSTDSDHLPFPPEKRRELDQHFYGQLWEPDDHPYQGYKREPLSTLPLKTQMLALIHKHRRLAENLDWDVEAVLSLKRDRFGDKGPLEVTSELLIQQAARGERQAVLKILMDGLVHPDVADSHGHTALMAATINSRNDVIHLLLDMGAEIDKLNFEGMSALSVCHILYYPFRSLCMFAESLTKSQDITGELSLTENQSSGNQRNAQPPEGPNQQDGDKALTPAQTFASCCSMYSYNIEVTEEVLQAAVEALSRTGFPQHFDTQETARRMAAVKFMHRARLTTLYLLLDRGADPNKCRLPLPVLFLAIMAGDTETVRRLLLCGAHTGISLPDEIKGLYPLHMATALPGPEGPKIIELLLHALSDPDARAGDQDEIYLQDMVCMIIFKLLKKMMYVFTVLQDSMTVKKQWWTENPCPEEGGRTPLHVACQRNTDHSNATKVVSILLSHSARTDLLWSGHSPLSLAISSGNDMAVAELLKGGADPNIPLSQGVGSALCALDMLEKAGADILMPVQVGDIKGTAVDYAHHSFNQDLRIANTPFHTLNMEERETFKTRRHLLGIMGDLLREAAVQREKEQFETEKRLLQNSEGATVANDNKPPMAMKQRKLFKFCYHCGRSAAVTLTACTRCHKVLYCSTYCKLKAWNKGHKEECVRETLE